MFTAEESFVVFETCPNYKATINISMDDKNDSEMRTFSLFVSSEYNVTFFPKAVAVEVTYLTALPVKTTWQCKVVLRLPVNLILSLLGYNQPLSQ